MSKLVGASTSTKQRKSSDSGRHLNIKVDHSAAPKTHELLTKNRGLDKSDHVFHKIAGASDNREKVKPAGTRTVAEKTIPLDDAPDGDFKEFNN